jgi:hypothetical protein
MSVKFYTLASQKIKRPLTKYNVISLDIPVVRLNLNKRERDYHIMFDDVKKLEVLKEYCKHEYLVTSVNINDIDYYCSLMTYNDKGILFIDNTYCVLDDLSTMIETKAYDFDEQKLSKCLLKLKMNKDGSRTLEVC